MQQKNATLRSLLLSFLASITAPMLITNTKIKKIKKKIIINK